VKIVTAEDDLSWTRTVAAVVPLIFLLAASRMFAIKFHILEVVSRSPGPRKMILLQSAGMGFGKEMKSATVVARRDVVTMSAAPPIANSLRDPLAMTAMIFVVEDVRL
jgi:hypothetical protein